MNALFPTFFLSGFECSSFLWKDGKRRNLVAECQHDVQANNDYKILHALGISVSREGIPWPMVDKGNGRYDFSSIAPMIAAMKQYGITPIWDLCHYGYPDGEDPFSTAFIKRFEAYCTAVAKHVSAIMDRPFFFTPINEITYFSFIGGRWGWVAPYKKSKEDYNRLRLSLCSAAIAGVKAIRSIIPHARMVHPDPLVQVEAPKHQPEKKQLAWHETYVETYLSWDILYGKEYPQLGGSPEVLDIVGINNYSVGFLEYGDEKGPHIAMQPNDQRILPLCSLLELVWKRYNRPMVISETSGVKEKRVPWMKDMMEETLAAINMGMDIQGVCFFPAIGSASWEYKEWVQSGFYNVEKEGNILQRKLYEPYVAELLRWQKQLKQVTMLSDEPFKKEPSINHAIEAAKRLQPKPDRNWER
jgi:beta-glucosidase/6-phospho-beta-glucosidase/beta-galactosidase